MKRIFIVAVFMLAAASSGVYAEPLKSSGTVEVFFSPNGGATDAIVREINTAKEEILVHAYSFTSLPIAKALLGAWKRGVKVEALLDASQRKAPYTSATFLSNAGIPVWIDDNHAIAHNKIMIIDRKNVITGEPFAKPYTGC